MLYILGGAARSGKTLMSRRMTAQMQVSYLSTDALIAMFGDGFPELDINQKHPFILKSEKLWKFSKPLCQFFISQEYQYLFEGDAILPSQVSELIKEGNEVRACFVGYTKLSAGEKLKINRKIAEGKGGKDWTNDLSDEELLPIIQRTIEYATYLQSECKKYGIPFFDVSTDFEKVSDQVFDYLTEKADKK